MINLRNYSPDEAKDLLENLRDSALEDLSAYRRFADQLENDIADYNNRAEELLSFMVATGQHIHAIDNITQSGFNGPNNRRVLEACERDINEFIRRENLNREQILNARQINIGTPIRNLQPNIVRELLQDLREIGKRRIENFPERNVRNLQNLAERNRRNISRTSDFINNAEIYINNMEETYNQTIVASNGRSPLDLCQDIVNSYRPMMPLRINNRFNGTVVRLGVNTYADNRNRREINPATGVNGARLHRSNSI
ncbi:MAG: hypothetical protein K6D38_09770 [Pseudobutyrivibrio sp.]|nr:hypothetical protein [Pseudobutyrivibrio sp.]